MLSSSRVRAVSCEIYISRLHMWLLGGRHLTQSTGSPSFVVISRLLARELLRRHLQNMAITVHTFDGTSDQRWLRYLRAKKVCKIYVEPHCITHLNFELQPMFVMLNDGGTLEESETPLAAARVLMQRVHIFNLMTQGLSCALLYGAEFRDSKVSLTCSTRSALIVYCYH